METSKNKTFDEDHLKAQLLERIVELEKLKTVRKSILKDAAIIGFIGVAIIIFGLYVHYAEWTEYPVIPFLIFAGGVFLAVAFRPLQRFKNDLEKAEEKLRDLQTLLKKDNLDYKADIQVTKNAKGEFEVKKNIQIVRIG